MTDLTDLIHRNAAYRERVARHEAGHAVVARRLGITVNRIDLRPSGKFGAHTDTVPAFKTLGANATPAEFAAAFYRDLQVALAGMAAHPGNGDYDGDIQAANACAFRVARHEAGLPIEPAPGEPPVVNGDPLQLAAVAVIERARRDVVALLDANRLAVERVVHALRSRDVLLPRKLDQLIGLAVR